MLRTTLLACCLCLAVPLMAQPPASQAPNTFAELRKRFESENSKAVAVRRRNIGYLAEFKTPGARQLILQLLTTEKNVSLRCALLRQLYNHPHINALAVLQKEFSTSKNSAVLGAAAHGLAGQGRRGLAVMIKVLRREEKGRRWQAALQALGAARESQEALTALMAEFQEAKPRRQVDIIAAVAAHESSAELTKLRLAALQSESVDVRAEALVQLARQGHPKVKAAALRMAASKKLLARSYNKAKVFYALGRVLDRQTIAAFLELGKEEDQAIRSLTETLFADKADVGRLASALGDLGLNRQNELQRITTVSLLSVCKDRAANKYLLQALRDPSLRIQSLALRALVKRREKRVVPYLEKKVRAENQDQDLKLEAMLALHSFRKQSSAWPKQLMRILAESKGFVRFAAVDLLAELRCRPALRAVQALVDEERWQLRSAVYGFLGVVRDTNSIPVLLAKLDEERGRLQEEAMSALRSLTAMQYRKAPQWQQWWQSVGKGFKLPPAPKDKDIVGRPASATMTYYSIPLTSKAVAFLIDTSGSMAERVGMARITRLEAAKRALNQVIDHCDPDFRFNLIPFSGSGQQWREGLSKAGEANKDSAKDFVGGLGAVGETNIYDALQRAFLDMTVDTIYLLSDGAPTVGPIIDQEELADEVWRWNRKRKIIIHTISIGTDSVLMQRLARESGGVYVRRI